MSFEIHVSRVLEGFGCFEFIAKIPNIRLLSCFCTIFRALMSIKIRLRSFCGAFSTKMWT